MWVLFLLAYLGISSLPVFMPPFLVSSLMMPSMRYGNVITPDAPWIKPPGMIESTISSLRFIAWSLFIYLLASPLLLVGYFIPPVGLVLQFLLGGYLLGREYGHLIELRMPRENRQKKPGRLAHGTIATFLWAFPLVNLVAPLVLGASLVHARLGTNKNTNNNLSQLKPPYSSE